MGWYMSNIDVYYAESWIYEGQTEITDWICYSAVENPSDDQWTLYKNEILIAGPSTNGSQGPNGIMLGGTGVFQKWANSQIGCLLVYSRALTAAEITQNFNALRARFGL